MARFLYFDSTMENEIWKAVPKFENKYWVSNLGRVKNSKNKILKPMVAKNQKYAKYGLSGGSRQKMKYIMGHRLVAMVFLENPNNYPIVHHRDNNPMNNAVSNLEWTTYSKNTKYAIESGRLKTIFTGEKNPVKRFSDYHVKAIRDLKSIGWSITELCDVFDCSRGYISEIINYKKRVNS